MIASCSYDNTCRIWDVNSGQLLKTLSGHTNNIASVCFSVDGKYLRTEHDSDCIKYWACGQFAEVNEADVPNETKFGEFSTQFEAKIKDWKNIQIKDKTKG